MRRKTIVLWLAVACASMILIAALIGAAAMHLAAEHTVANHPLVDTSATGYSGSYKVHVTLHSLRRRCCSATIAVSSRDWRIATGTIAVALHRPTARALWHSLRGRSGVYKSVLPVDGTGPWNLQVAIGREPAHTAHDITFFLYQPVYSLTSSTRLMFEASSSNTGSMFDVGPFRASFNAGPSNMSRSTFRVKLLSSKAASLPSFVALSLTMFEMDMGTIRTKLQRTARGYAGSARFPMAGPWAVRVNAGKYSGLAALRIVSGSPRDQRPSSGFRPFSFSTGLPYRGFVTQMGRGTVARLNNGVAYVGQTPHGVDFVPGQPYVLVTDMGGDQVRIVDIHSGDTSAVIPVGLAPAHIVFSSNARKAFVTDFLSSDVSVIDVRRRRLIARVPVGLNPHGLDITPDGRYVYVACAHSGGVYVLSTTRNRVVGVIPTGIEPYGLTMGPTHSGKAYVSDYTMNQVDVVSTRMGRVTKRIKVGRSPALMIAAPNGLLYVADHGSSSVTVIRMRTDRVVATIRVGSGPHGLDATPDGKYVYVANNNSNTVSIISTALNRVTHTVRVPGEPNEVALQQRDDLRP